MTETDQSPQSRGKELYLESEQIREAGDFDQGILLADQAREAFLQEGNIAGAAMSESSKMYAYIPMAQKTGSREYLELGKKAALDGVGIAEKSGDPTTLTKPLLDLGRALEACGELPEAVNAYRRAVDNITSSPNSEYKKASAIADFRLHLALAEYRNGDKQALERAEVAVHDLEAITGISDEQLANQNGQLEFSQERSFLKNVWVTGGHIKLAGILKTQDPLKAKEYLQKAKEIIDVDPRLVIRAQQWEQLSKDLVS